MVEKTRAVVLLSGGQDSTTCLYWAKKHCEVVAAINIQYGQRHVREIEVARKIAKLADVELVELSFPAFKEVGGSAMLEGGGEIGQREDGLPTTFLPGRNLVFVILAAVVALQRGARMVVTGVCQTDYSGYPDCREVTMRSLEETLHLGMGEDIRVVTPLMYLTKAQTVKLAKGLSGCWEALALSHTCYRGEHPPCGECPACKLRQRGFEEAGYTDPLLEV